MIEFLLLDDRRDLFSNFTHLGDFEPSELEQSIISTSDQPEIEVICSEEEL
jgi:hypothetical protein